MNNNFNSQENVLDTIYNLSDSNVKVTLPVIEYQNLEQLNQQINLICNYLSTVVVNEETLKANKKLVAKVRKAVKEINQTRINLKKKILEPFEAYETFVKKISDKATYAEKLVRVQIRNFDEKERELKEIKIREIFNKRIVHYPFSDKVHFEQFLQPYHLNKTTTMKTVESEMVAFLEKTKSELATVTNFIELHQLDTNEWIDFYFSTQDLALTISEMVKAISVTEDKNVNPEENTGITYRSNTVVYRINKNYESLVDNYLRTNEIEFRKSEE